MKKILLIAVLFITCTFAANAQTGNGYKNALGIRGAYGAEISYQRYISPANRLEGTLGINRYGFSAEALYQWMFELPSNSPGIWQWYAGAGAGLGSWSNSHFKSGFSLGVQGQIGIEYTFAKAPLVMSIDYRPGVYIIPEAVVDWTGLALGIRYCF
jgi:hypothetical protein